MSDLRRRLDAINTKLDGLPPVPPPGYRHFSDDELIALLQDTEGRLAKMQALEPAERQRWRRELDDACGLRDDIPDRLKRMTDEELEYALVRAEAKWKQLERDSHV